LVAVEGQTEQTRDLMWPALARLNEMQDRRGRRDTVVVELAGESKALLPCVDP
jgi:hypothetical protein